MDLYLVRHGQAESPAGDPERGLTDLGIKQADAAAEWAAEAGARVTQIWHSGKKRAVETAEIFAKHLHPPGGVLQAGGLLPNDDVVPVADLVESGSESVMIVGHLPFLPRLASVLVAGDPERVGFGMFEGSVVCLHRRDGRWYAKWMVSPNEVLSKSSP